MTAIHEHPRLIAKDGDLYLENHALFNESHLLIYRYPDGDIDLVQWPNYDETHLRSVLFDAREYGGLPADTYAVVLPDGKVFTI